MLLLQGELKWKAYYWNKIKQKIKIINITELERKLLMIFNSYKYSKYT